MSNVYSQSIYIWAATWENQQYGFCPGLTQTRLYNYWSWLEAWNFVFRKKRYCTIQVAKTKALFSYAVFAKLICVFVFAYADCWFSHDAAYMYKQSIVTFSRPSFLDAFSYICKQQVFVTFGIPGQLRPKFIRLCRNSGSAPSNNYCGFWAPFKTMAEAWYLGWFNFQRECFYQ